MSCRGLAGRAGDGPAVHLFGHGSHEGRGCWADADLSPRSLPSRLPARESPEGAVPPPRRFQRSLPWTATGHARVGPNPLPAWTRDPWRSPSSRGHRVLLLSSSEAIVLPDWNTWSPGSVPVGPTFASPPRSVGHGLTVCPTPFGVDSDRTVCPARATRYRKLGTSYPMARMFRLCVRTSYPLLSIWSPLLSTSSRREGTTCPVESTSHPPRAICHGARGTSRARAPPLSLGYRLHDAQNGRP